MKTVYCDWGTTNLRAYLLENGQIIDKYTSPNGLKKARELGFKNVFQEIFTNLNIDLDTPIKLSGMVGSKHGWKEAPYASTPVAISDIQDNYITIDDYPNVQIFGGVSHKLPNGKHDVMRGEEVQIFGILSKYPDAKLICLPGTHAKWVKTEKGQIKSFNTWMTGDFFNCLSGHTIFKEQITNQDFDQKAFINGVNNAKDSGPILNSAFYLRTDYLWGKVCSEEFHSYLSGFLIGHEIKGAAQQNQEVILSGSERMVPYYKEALKCFDVKAIEMLSSEATILGMKRISAEMVYG